MPGTWSQSLNTAVLNHLFTGASISVGAWTPGANTYLGLLTNSTGLYLDDALSWGPLELNPATYPSYDRLEIGVSRTWAPLTNDSGYTPYIANAQDWFWLPQESWGLVSHIALFDSGTPQAGNVIAWGALAEGRALGAGDRLYYPTGSLRLAL